MNKILTWIKVNIASLVNAVQLVVKALKELLTAVINLLSIFFPVVGSQKLVLLVRAALEWVDAKLEWIKTKLVLIPVI
jgi:hypothetical protein